MDIQTLEASFGIIDLSKNLSSVLRHIHFVHRVETKTRLSEYSVEYLSRILVLFHILKESSFLFDNTDRNDPCGPQLQQIIKICQN